MYSRLCRWPIQRNHTSAVHSKPFILCVQKFTRIPPVCLFQAQIHWRVIFDECARASVLHTSNEKEQYFTCQVNLCSAEKLIKMMIWDGKYHLMPINSSNNECQHLTAMRFHSGVDFFVVLISIDWLSFCNARR